MTLVPGRRHYLAIFLLSLSLLMLEITVARILSVALLSHYAFVAISLAMFGLALSGLVVYLFPAHFTAEKVDAQLIAYSWRFGLSAALSVLIFLHIRVIQELSPTGFILLSVAYGVLAVPFFCGGLCVSLLMTHFSGSIGRIYFADLVGASLGCVGVVVAMQLMPAPHVVLLIASVVSLATLLVATATTPRRVLAPALACAILAALVVLGIRTNLFTMRYVKHWSDYYSDYEAWNAFSRLSAFDSEKFFGQGSSAASVVPLPKSSEAYKGGTFPKTMILDIDGAAWTPMMNFNGDVSSIQFLRDSVLYAAHHLKPNADVLVIGTGGGRDLLAALAFGQKSIQGIEINPLMRHIVEDRYGDYSGHPYTRYGINVIIDEGRSRLAHLDRTFDIIQLSLIDTFSLNAAGGVVFSENYLYTKEALEEYFQHLSDGGILSLTRYYIPAYPLEILRLIAMAREAWAKQGVDSLGAHLIVLSQGINATMLVKRSPFSEQEVARIDQLAGPNRFSVLYKPGIGNAGDKAIAALVTTLSLRQHLDAYPFNIDAPTDDRPFFFNFLRNRNVDVSVDPFQFLKQWRDALSLMYLLIAVVATMAVLFLVGPLFLLRSRNSGTIKPTLAIPLLLYFACLGYGFMMIEIPLLQRFVLFLGYPVYALAVVLFALLLFSGIGSLVSARFTANPRRALFRILITVIMTSLGYVYALPSVIGALLALPIAVRILSTIVLLAPIGLLLGMPYPLGITILRGFGEGLVPWAWGLNGAMSVMASVVAIFIGSRVGFSVALLTGIAAYLVALVTMSIATASRSVALEAHDEEVGVARTMVPRAHGGLEGT